MEDDPVEGSGDDGVHESPSRNLDANRRACDACRARKIRCDRGSPCSHCAASKILCSYAAIEPRKKRTRILLTTQYERKIDLIDHRLDKMVKLLETLHVNERRAGSTTQSLGYASTPAKAPSSISTPASDAIQSDSAAASVAEGESSLAAHSVFASDFLEKIAVAGSLRESDPEICEAMDALSNIVTALKQPSAANEMAYPHARPVQRPSLPGCELPPIQKAVALIRIARTQRLAGTGWIYEFLPFQRFSDMCLGVYFSEDHSEADFITVNAGLYSLFWDYSFHVSAEEKGQWLRYAHMCRDNLETALSNLPLHLPANSNMILALIFGAFHAIEISKPLLSWSLSSKASELCQTLGYHRVASIKNDRQDDIQYKEFLFWSVYFIDKSLSLRLGRASAIPDWDITIKQPSTSDPVSEPVLAYYVLWIEAARIQGNIYEMLYSPNAISQPDDVRQSRVDTLVSDLRHLEKETEETNKKWIKTAKENSGSALMDFFYISDDVHRTSLLTHVYRAAPREANSLTTFNPDCVNAARATLERHQDCMAATHENREAFFSIYMHWTLLFAPFIPFIVIFCHVIETKDRTDLARLHAFLTSIESASSVSEPASKIYRLFQVLYSIALHYVEFHLYTAPAGHSQASTEIGVHLGALGFSPVGLCVDNGQQQQQQTGLGQRAGVGLGQTTDDHGGIGMGDIAGRLRVANPMMWMGNGVELEDWLDSNEAIMRLCDESGFNSSNPN